MCNRKVLLLQTLIILQHQSDNPFIAMILGCKEFVIKKKEILYGISFYNTKINTNCMSRIIDRNYIILANFMK